MMTRNQEQEKLMLIIYQILFFDRMKSDFDIVNILEETMEQPYDEISLFIKEVSVKVAINYKELYKMIEPCCLSWKISRINLTNIAILMLGIAEFKYLQDVDKAIIINVCVKLSKRYGDEKDYKFINAVLDKLL